MMQLCCLDIACDVLQAGTKQFRAHKSVLSLRSDYFRILLTNADFREGRYNAQILKGEALPLSKVQELYVGFADPEIVATALMWMYTDRLPKDLPSDHLLEARLLPISLFKGPTLSYDDSARF